MRQLTIPLSVKAKFYYASWFGAHSKLVRTSVMEFGFYGAFRVWVRWRFV